MDIIGILKRVHHTLRNAQHVLLVPHRHPDADSLAAALIMRDMLKTMNIRATLWCKTDIPDALTFMMEQEKMGKNIPSDIDVICVFDSGDAQYAYLPDIIAELPKPGIIINIDHHASNQQYGNINLVMPHMPSTTAVLYTMIDQLGMHVTLRMAQLMMTGLINDTGAFSNPATNQHAMIIGAALMEAGAHIPNIITTLYRVKPIGVLKLWGRALERIKKHARLPIAYTVLTQNDHQECGVSYEESAGLANFFNMISDCPISLILKETSDGHIKGSLRTTQDTIDVSKLALALGGGGHTKAAGFTIPGRLEQTSSGWKII